MLRTELDKNLGQPIFITGCPRSYTSLVAEIVNKLGFFGGEICRKNSGTNPHGTYENLGLRENVTKPYLEKHGFDPRGQDIDRLADPGKLYPCENLRSNVLNEMAKQGLEPGQPWFYKDPKICKIWRVWAEHFPEAHWITVHRNVQDTIQSCIKTGFMDQYATAEDWHEYVKVYRRASMDLFRHAENAWIVWPEDGIENTSYLEPLCQLLEVPYDEELIRKCIHKKK